jgi:hypothetical protein
MNIPDEVRKSVAFACYRDHKGEIRYGGTVFFVIDIVSDSGGYATTVTAKHVVVEIERDSIDRMVLLRVNRLDGDIDSIEIATADWKFHPSTVESVDVAVYDWTPDSSIYDVMQTPISMAVLPEIITTGIVGLGDEIFIVGLFINHRGKKRNLPIIRLGNIAMLPDKDEQIATRRFGDMEGFLIESRSIGGLSGSPVFDYKDHFELEREGSQIKLQQRRKFFWLGLIHGHYDIEPNEDALVEDIPKREIVNMGIAIVVPAYKILETINQPQILAVREEDRKKREGITD